MRVTTSMLAIAAGAVVTVTGLAPAAAQDPASSGRARLGQRGQTIITSDVALDYQRSTVSLEGEDDVTVTRFDFHAGFDRVLPHRLTLGARLGFAGQIQDLVSTKAFDIGARFGGLVPLGGSAVWWPTAGFAYGLTSVGDRDSSVTIRTVTLVLQAPFLWQPERHVLVGAGPTYHRDLQARTGPDADDVGPKVSAIGVHGYVGFWF
jgi:hypothetical protein